MFRQRQQHNFYEQNILLWMHFACESLNGNWCSTSPCTGSVHIILFEWEGFKCWNSSISWMGNTWFGEPTNERTNEQYSSNWPKTCHTICFYDSYVKYVTRDALKIHSLLSRQKALLRGSSPIAKMLFDLRRWSNFNGKTAAKLQSSTTDDGDDVFFIYHDQLEFCRCQYRCCKWKRI